jgi:hypothetical protein
MYAEVEEEEDRFRLEVGLTARPKLHGLWTSRAPGRLFCAVGRGPLRCVHGPLICVNNKFGPKILCPRKGQKSILHVGTVVKV